jgi:hypothetical protein
MYSGNPSELNYKCTREQVCIQFRRIAINVRYLQLYGQFKNSMSGPAMNRTKGRLIIKKMHDTYKITLDRETFQSRRKKAQIIRDVLFPQK